MGSMTCEVSPCDEEACYSRLISISLASGWTLNNAIQSHVDLYVSQSTFKEVQRAFPYLVSKEFASGGGDVRAIRS